MKNAWLVDANAILCYLLKDIPASNKDAEQFFEEVRSGAKRAVVTEGVLAETVFILSRHYQVPRSELCETLSGLLRYKGMSSEVPVFLDSLATFEKTGLDFIDCVLITRARIAGVGVFTFDRKLAKELERKRKK
ncbi:MAG: PIN domain-containing protein [Geobacter sp.]|nr:PIN domain-containing protein [Geobacter sp.]